FLRSRTLGYRIAHIRIPRHGGVHLLLREQCRRLDAILRVDGLAEDLIALVDAKPGALKPVPQQKVRRSVGSERDRLAGQILDAVDALLADDAVRPARPIHHIDGVRAYAFFLKLIEV